jgi:hypothetical protein
MNWTDLMGYAASSTVLATFCMNSMRRLRLLAITSNILFIAFGAMAHIHPVLLLHLILLPVNLAHLSQVRWQVGARRALRHLRSALSLSGLGTGSIHRTFSPL